MAIPKVFMPAGKRVYNVRMPDGVRTYKLNLLGMEVSRQTDFRWNLSEVISRQTDFRWNLSEVISRQTDFRWNLSEVISRQTDLRWSLGECVDCAVAGNIFDQPNDMSNWVVPGPSSSITLNQAVSPDCTQNADKVSLAVGEGPVTLLQSTGSSAAFELKFWIKKLAVTNATVRLVNSFSAAAGRWVIDLALIGDDWEQLSSAHAAVTETDPWTQVSGNLAIDMDHFQNDTPAEFYAWCWSGVET